MGVITDERDEVIRALTRHCGDGRLTLDELEERITEAYAATTDAELRHVLRDLPVEAHEPVTMAAEPATPRMALPPRPEVTRVEPPEWEKPVGALFVIGGFVLLFNGMFILAMICWFVLPGMVLTNKNRCR
ncbi:MAG TPA: DUF1707 domain-containing protein [Acidimicrobiales bacterium]|nr:DUF1707 domain-containing protein [Acidimicrobiales bacterium]